MYMHVQLQKENDCTAAALQVRLTNIQVNHSYVRKVWGLNYILSKDIKY